MKAEFLWYPLAELPDLPLAFDPWVFNTATHLRLQGRGEPCWIFCLKVSEKIVARLAFFERKNMAISPLRATFGGIECAEDTSEEWLNDFLTSVENWCVERSITNIQLRQAPEGISPVSQKIRKILLTRGFEIEVSDLNLHLILPHSEANLHRSQRLRLHKAQRLGWGFRQTFDLPAFYTFLVAARQRRGHPVTMSLEDLEQHFAIFPGHFSLFEVHDAHQQTTAMALIVHLNNHVLYTLYLADCAGYEALSPIVYLIKNLAEHAYTHGYEVLDLGISSDGGIINEGLTAFKKRLGGVQSERVVYGKKLV